MTQESGYSRKRKVENPEKASRGDEPLRPYEAPRLTDHGEVTSVTEGTTLSGGDMEGRQL